MRELCRKEREVLVRLLWHLNENERRGLYWRMGFPSLLAYMTGALGYCEDEARQRLAAAHALREFPVLETAFLSGELDLQTFADDASEMTAEELAAILERLGLQN